MSYTNGLDKPTDYFNTVLYTGDGATSTAGSLARTISGVGFQSDWTWVKGRTSGGYNSHGLHDAVRGAPKWLRSDGTSAEADVTTGFSAGGIGSFTSDGFGIYSGTAGTTTNYNTSSTNYVAWNWLASNTTASNTDGSITSTVSANTTSGFSIVSYTGNGNSGQTVGHGLGSTVDMVIVKDRSRGSENWVIYHKSLGKDKLLLFNTDAAATSSNYWGSSTPNSTVFGVKDGNTSNNWSGDNFIAYCFAEKKGYSKFGSYTGNGNADGTFVYTGFKPAWFLVKNTSISRDWQIFDNKRLGYNVDNNYLFANLSDAEGTADRVDLLSSGVKWRTSANTYNASGNNYIFMAFAENPFVTSTGIPTTAR